MSSGLQHSLFLLWMFYLVGANAQSHEEVLEYLDHSNEDVVQQLEHLDKSIQRLKEFNQSDSLAMLYYVQSRLFFRGGVSIEKSIESLDNAIGLINADDHRNLWIKLWYYKGYWYRKWDKYEEAKKSLSEVLKYSNENEYLWDATIQMGKTFKDRGEFSVALEYYDRALVLAGKDKDRLSTTYEVISFVYLIMETKEGAEKSLPWLDKLLLLLEQMEGQEHFKASMTYNKGCAYMTMEDYENATIFFDASERIINKCCNDDDFKSLLFESRAGLLVEQGNYQKALEFYNKSLELYEHSFDLTRSDGLASSYRQIAVAYDKMGDQSEALKYITKALSYRLSGIDNVVDSVEINLSNLQANGEKHYLIDELLLKANILLNAFDVSRNDAYLEEASDILTYADDVVDFMRFEHIEESTKEFWRSKTSEVFKLLVKVNYKLERFESAFHYAEKSKYLLMGEHLIRKRNDLQQKSLSNEMRLRLRNTRAEIERVKEQINDSNNSQQRSSNDTVKAFLVELRKNEDDLLSEIKETYPNYFADNFSFQLATTREIRNLLLNENQTFIEYFLDGNELYIFVVDRHKFQVKLVSLPFELSNKIEDFQLSISHHARNAPKYLQLYATTAHDLFDVTLGNIEEVLNKEIIIVADDVLSLIPFSILLTELVDVEKDNVRLKSWPYLMKEYRLSYLKSASLGLLQAHQIEKVSFDAPILAINPSFEDHNKYASSDNDSDILRGNLDPLYGSEEEILFIQDRIDGSYLMKDQATEYNFKKALDKSYSIFHLASHAFVDNKDPEFSKLVLDTPSESSEDGLLHVYEIANLSIQSDLVVLSACNTGFGKIQEGEGVNSLGKSFARAGSPNLLMSLWPVNDQATSSLIIEFYRHIFEGKSKRSATTDAKRTFLESVPAAFHHPYYWGGFVYYGDDEPIQLNSSKLGIQELFIGTLSVFILFVIGRRILV